jgi:hypothetical protein
MSTAAGNGLGTTINYLVSHNAGAGNNWAKAIYTIAGTNSEETSCIVAFFVVN